MVAQSLVWCKGHLGVAVYRDALARVHVNAFAAIHSHQLECTNALDLDQMLGQQSFLYDIKYCAHEGFSLLFGDFLSPHQAVNQILESYFLVIHKAIIYL